MKGVVNEPVKEVCKVEDIERSDVLNYRVDKLSGVVYNTKLITYDISIKQKVRDKVRRTGYDDNLCLSVVVTNMLSCYRKGSILVYSRRKGEKNTSRRGITARRLIKAIDFLVSLGLVVNRIGVPHKNRDKRTISTLSLTDKFIDEWCGDIVLCREAEKSFLENIEVIELRDKNKQKTDYESSEHIEQMSMVLRDLNQMNEAAVIKNGDGGVLTNIYCRIFNETFNFGGRFYRADVLSIKNKDDDARLDITIDGDRVCEVDFNNLHFRIAASLEDIGTEYMPIDVYSGILEDEENPVDRRIVKLGVMMMFNSNNHTTCRKAIQQQINKLSDAEKEIFTLGSATTVMALIVKAYPDFEHLFCNNESFGRILQNCDSHLASDILDKMIDLKIPTLVVHDSFIVAIEHMNVLCDIMGDCYRDRFGDEVIVPVSIKYKEGGVLIKESVLV